MKKEALLLIDIQEIYFVPGPYLLHKPQVAADNAKILLDRFREEEKTIIHIKHDFKSCSKIHKTVKPLSNEKVIIKQYPSAFLGTDLEEYLKSQNVENLVVAGMMSHMCVDTTVRACQDYGYGVTVIENACTTKDLCYNNKILDAETVHNAFMASLNGMFARVIKLDEYMNLK